MKFTRLKTTVMAGMLATSMLMPGMTAFASETPQVKKTVEVADGVTLPDTDITFTATLDKNADGNVTPDTAPKTLTIAKANFKDLVKGDAGLVANLDITIPDTITSNPGVYTYKIVEDAVSTDSEGYGWTKTSGETYYLHIIVGQTSDDVTYYASTTNEIRTVTVDGEKKTGFLDENGESTKSNLEYTNKYTKKGNDDNSDEASLTITKSVDKDSTIPTTTKYTFTLNFYTNDLNPDTQVTYEKDGVEKKGYAYTKSDDDATYYVADGETIELLKGQTASFTNIPAGTYVNVTETYVTNLDKVQINYTSNGTPATGEQKDATVANNLKLDSSADGKGMLIGEDTNSITYTNTYKDVTVTGVVTSIAPYVTLVVVAVAAVAAYVVLKRRVAR